MEISWIVPVLLIAGGAMFAALALAGGLKKKRREMSRAGLANRANEEARRLRDFVERREESRPERDSVVRDHELSSHRVTLHDEETRELYVRDHLPEVAELRRQLREHGVRDEVLDNLHESAENGSELRSVSTALFEAARRLRPGA